MRKEALFALGAFALVVVVFGLSVWLASAPLHPPVETVHAAVPDERIPH